MSEPIPLPPLLELATAQLEVALQNSNSHVERLAASVDAFSRLGAELRAHADPAVGQYSKETPLRCVQKGEASAERFRVAKKRAPPDRRRRCRTEG